MLLVLFFNLVSCYFFLFKFYFIFKLYITVLVLPNIKMNLPQVYMCSPSWTLLPPHSIPLGRPSAPAPRCILKHWCQKFMAKWKSVQFSRSVMSNSLRPYEPQHARPPCPSPTAGVYPNTCPLGQWCHPTISFSSVQSLSCVWLFATQWIAALQAFLSLISLLYFLGSVYKWYYTVFVFLCLTCFTWLNAL